MAKNTQLKPYDGMLLFRQNHPYTKEDFEVMKQNFQKHCGPLCPAKDEPTSFVMLGYVSRDLCGELVPIHEAVDEAADLFVKAKGQILARQEAKRKQNNSQSQ